MKQFVNTLMIALVALALMASGVQKTQTRDVKKPAGKKAKETPPQISYRKDIRPIVKKYCLPCHSEDEMNPSELYLDTYENIAKGGKHGKPIVPGNADTSLIVLKLSGKPPIGDPMPLKRKTPFPQDTLQIIKTWINQGAKNN